jgi:hypothetical protein
MSEGVELGAPRPAFAQPIDRSASTNDEVRPAESPFIAILHVLARHTPARPSQESAWTRTLMAQALDVRGQGSAHRTSPGYLK